MSTFEVCDAALNSSPVRLTLGGLKGNGIIEELEVFSAKAAFLEGMSPGPLKGKPEIDPEMR
jgi:hypothetical protein